ncbi:hypothetical protein FH972_012696 [Carpinus fangiana]|uniref:Uncharacterized protein n=1 Tax=Carpinus fangiana TaxID=176857 RepID=A0A5N6R6Z0_9ROSI|nr:hypothetical protein FH972_012696 [Carpinus fangiana]
MMISGDEEEREKKALAKNPGFYLQACLSVKTTSTIDDFQLLKFGLGRKNKKRRCEWLW